MNQILKHPSLTLTPTKQEPPSHWVSLALKQRSCARKRKRCESDFEASIVDLDTYKTPSPEPPSHWVSNLTVKDEQVLTHGRWLNDSLVNASQLLSSIRLIPTFKVYKMLL